MTRASRCTHTTYAAAQSVVIGPGIFVWEHSPTLQIRTSATCLRQLYAFFIYCQRGINALVLPTNPPLLKC